MKRNTYRRNLLIINKIDIYQVLFYRENHQHHTSSYSFSFSASVVRTRLGSWAASGSQFCQHRFNFVAFVAGILACWSHTLRPRHHVFRSRRPQFHRNPRRHHSPVLTRKCSENSRFSPQQGRSGRDFREYHHLSCPRQPLHGRPSAWIWVQCGQPACGVKGRRQGATRN